MNTEYCSKCGRVVIENGRDMILWVAEEKGSETIYTCAFCQAGVESGSIEAKVLFGPYSEGGMPQSYEQVIEQELGFPLKTGH